MPGEEERTVVIYASLTMTNIYISLHFVKA